MVNILVENISKFIYENRDKIPVIDTVIVTDMIWGRLDIVTNRYFRGLIYEAGYGEYVDVFPYYQLLLDFNNITNPIEIRIGQVIDIPDMIYVLDSISLYTDSVCGVINNGVKNLDSDNVQTIQRKSDSFKTTAIPKLKITQKKVNYDSVTGLATF